VGIDGSIELCRRADWETAWLVSVEQMDQIVEGLNEICHLNPLAEAEAPTVTAAWQSMFGVAMAVPSAAAW
jgi:hypothetical protein